MIISQDLAGKSKDELLAVIAAMQVASQRKLTLKVTAHKTDDAGKVTGTSGAISLYGLGRFPITLYRTQWERLLNEAEHIRAFIDVNVALLATKD